MEFISESKAKAIVHEISGPTHFAIMRMDVKEDGEPRDKRVGQTAKEILDE